MLASQQHRMYRGTHATSRASAPARPQRRFSTFAQASTQQHPSFLPSLASEIKEEAAHNLMKRMKRLSVDVPSYKQPVLTAAVAPTEDERAKHAGSSPIVMLHGFDSSSLEFRRLYPLLAEQTQTWAVDLVGWGFTDNTAFSADTDLVLSPQQKREHLYALWQQHIKEPMVLLGASLGGAVALDFAYHHPEAVKKIVLIDAQGFIDGIGPMAKLPRFFATLGVSVLKTEGLRMAANKMAYFNKEKFATNDAMKIGRLHTHLPGWLDANVAFMRSGGYSISSKISEIVTPTLVMWGRQDEILETSYASRFEQTLPNGKLVWVEECGHCAHLEQPQLAAQTIMEFIRETAEVEVAADVLA